MKFNKRSDVFVEHDPFFKDEIWRVVSIILTFKSTKRAPTNPCPFDSLQIKQATKPELPGVAIWRRARSPSFEGHSVPSISVCYVSGCHGLPLCSLKFWTTFTKVLQHSNSALEPHGCMNRAAVVQAASCLGSSGFQGRKPITNRAVSNEGTRTGAIWDAASLDSIPKVTTGCTCCRLSPTASFRLMVSPSPQYVSKQLGMKNLGLFYLRLPICVFVEIKPRLSPSPSFGNMILVDAHVFAGYTIPNK